MLRIETRRVSQEVNSVVSEYLLDVQPELWKVLAETSGGSISRYLHGPRGIQAMEDTAGTWRHSVQDGLGSVRAEVQAGLAVSGRQHYAPYGVEFGQQGALAMPFGFTGEPVDVNDLLYLRARQYSPALGVFTGLDPVEGTLQRAMSLNGYSWVEGNTPNLVDRSGSYPCIDDDCDPNVYFLYRELQRLNNIIQDGLSDGYQQECFSGPYSPFGCDRNGSPIKYVLTQGFGDTPNYDIVGRCDSASNWSAGSGLIGTP